jgi:hypothetical protein
MLALPSEQRLFNKIKEFASFSGRLSLNETDLVF